MRFIISLALIIGFCVLLLVGLLSVLQDLFARSVHSQPSIPAPKPAHRQCDPRLSEGHAAG
jgi:TRAP-type C4-dicarboxylate transport system permease small subunit